jgi:hypothetical protein
MPVTSTETVGRELMKRLTRTREISKSQLEEENAGIIPLNPLFHTECAIQED